MEHIRRPDTLDNSLADALKAVLKLARTNPSVALRVVFRKADGTIRTMDIAYDDKIDEAFSHNLTDAQKDGNEARRDTNATRRNLVVRERVRGEDGNYAYQWRTIPLKSILSVSPML